MPKKLDLIGQKYGEWTVLQKVDKPKNSSSTSSFWLCRCSCGTERVMSANVLRQGKSKSCGCKTKELKLNSSSEDLTGWRFGLLTVLKRVPKPENLKSTGAYWLCKCDCGTEKIIMGKSLRQGKTISCGCHKQQYNNLLGQRFGKLTVIDREPKSNKWTCLCDCGNITYVQGNNLQNGNVKSCGCLTSYGEFLIENILKQNNINYVKQYSFKDLFGPKNGLLRFDFAIINNNSLDRLIEFQGEQHYKYSYSKFFDDNILLTDKIKKQYCQEHNIKLVCIPYWKRENLTIEDILGSKYLIKAEREMEE